MRREKVAVRRSKKTIFASFCLLNQGIRAQGVSIKFPAIVKPILNFLMENEINIVQMPCPEIHYEGVVRKAARKETYDNLEFRQICKKIAKQVLDIMLILLEAEYSILGVLGIENSPTCGVNYVFRERIGRVHEAGVFIEELQGLLPYGKLKEVTFLGLQIYNIKRSLFLLKDVIFRRTTLQDFSGPE